MDWIGQHWLVWLSLLLVAAGVMWMMPRAAVRPKAVGLLLVLGGLVLLAWRMDDWTSSIDETVMFWLFSAAAILSAVLMITNRKPVYSALWFAMVTLSVCALFMLQYAPFLAAATVVIYAGAIVVTFVFVIMLAQQNGATVYDHQSRQPLLATAASFGLLIAIVGTLLFTSDRPRAGATAVTTTQESQAMTLSEPLRIDAGEPIANPLSRVPNEQRLSRIRALGRSLFGDYLFAVEMAGTLLLVATIGAIAIAPRRRRGTL